MPKQFTTLTLATTLAAAGLCAVAAQTPAPATANVWQVPPADPGPKVPEGFTPIFNGKDLTGWHVSKTNHHGTTPDYRVLHGLIVGTQNPRGKGGILLTDKKYKNFEVYIDGNLILTLTATAPHNGSGGFQARGTNANFGEIVVE